MVMGAGQQCQHANQAISRPDFRTSDSPGIYPRSGTHAMSGPCVRARRRRKNSRAVPFEVSSKLQFATYREVEHVRIIHPDTRTMTTVFACDGSTHAREDDELMEWACAGRASWEAGGTARASCCLRWPAASDASERWFRKTARQRGEHHIS